MEQVHTDQRASIAVPSAPQVGPALVCFQCHWGSGQTPSFLQVPAPQERSVYPHPYPHLQDIEEKGGRVSEISRWTPGRNICIQLGPYRSDAHPHLRLRAGDADRQGVGLVQQGQKAWAGSSRGAQAAKSQSSGGATCHLEGCPSS